MRNWIAFLVGGLLLTGAAFAAEPDPCEVPAYLLFSDAELTRVEKAAKDTQQVKVLVVGSGSSLLTGGGGPALSYPARLEAALKAKLPGVAVTVKTFAKPRQTAEDMLKDLEKLVQEEKPNLVIWQTGTIDAMRGLDPEDFRLTLDEGVETIHANGADVVLMNSQYSPRTESLIANTAYTDNMRWVAQHRNVPLYDRLAIMRHWSDNGTFDFTVAGRDFTLAQKVHNCIGKTLAAQIMESSRLAAAKPKN